MAIRTLKILQGLWHKGIGRPHTVARGAGVKIVLPARPSAGDVAKPPVRIFVGTEAAQFRAERVLLWSIERTRDPAREYEIHLLKDLAGFDRSLWLTGFTNYRYAIPELGGFAGRAIYNDVDQIYLDDPGRLFDTDMRDHGVLSIDDRDTSVMLIDCARLAENWNLRTARAANRRRLEAPLREQPGLWGRLDGAWNARDGEYSLQHSRLIHYTTIHAQPWRPQPRDYVYQENAAAGVWFALERQADAAGFNVFDAAQPSPDFPAALLSGVPKPAAGHSRAAAAQPVDAAPDPQPWQALAGALTALPDWDVPWVLDGILQAARHPVTVTVDLTRRPPRAPADPHWWQAQMAAAAARRPDASWRLELHTTRRPGAPRVRYTCGGPPIARPPRTWVLLYYKAGHRSQALGLAEALGWPFETRDIGKPWRYLRAAFGRSDLLAPPQLAGGIEPPWPDLVIASGWLPGIVARWIARRNRGNTRLVLLGRKAGSLGESQDIAVGCRHFRFPPEPRRIDTVLPPGKVNRRRLAEAAQRWPQLFDGRPRPRVVLLVGGSCAQYRLDPATAAHLIDDVQRHTEAVAGSLVVVTSPRTGRAATEAIVASARPATAVEVWSRRPEHTNPFLGYLALADILVVTGESESMLAEAVAAGKPVYIHPLPRRRVSLTQRLAGAVHRRAMRDRINARGTPRPQQGVQYLCARAIERRWIVPPRDLDMLHQGLLDLGVARFFGEPFHAWQPQPWREIDGAAERIRRLLGITPDHDPAAIPEAA
jgi:mitochondrial fission protein ELM1